jgi:hypothetical protein
MALAQAQRALATLCTDEAARVRLRDDPAAFAREFSLDAGGLAQVQALGDAQLHAYVASLERKRAAEAVRLLPVSARTGGPELRRAFAAHARRVPLGGEPDRYVRDVIRFAEQAVRDMRDAPRLRDLLDYEATWLHASSAAAFARVRCYAFPVARLAREVAAGAPAAAVARRPTLVVWLAVAGRRTSFVL